MNGVVIEGPVTNDKLVGGEDKPNSGKLLIGQGNLDIQTDASVGGTLGNLHLPENGSALDTLSAVLQALAPNQQNAPLVGVIGGEGSIDANTVGLLKAIAGIEDNKFYQTAIKWGAVSQEIQEKLGTVTNYVINAAI